MVPRSHEARLDAVSVVVDRPTDVAKDRACLDDAGGWAVEVARRLGRRRRLPVGPGRAGLSVQLMPEKVRRFAQSAPQVHLVGERRLGDAQLVIPRTGDDDVQILDQNQTLLGPVRSPQEIDVPVSERPLGTRSIEVARQAVLEVAKLIVRV